MSNEALAPQIAVYALAEAITIRLRKLEDNSVRISVEVMRLDPQVGHRLLDEVTGQSVCTLDEARSFLKKYL